MLDVPLGIHARGDDPLAEARSVDATVVQCFLADPQSWRAPSEHPRATALREAAAAGDPAVYVHAPYVVNVASSNNRIRIPSRTLLGQHAAVAARIGARGLVVHGGHVVRGTDPAEGLRNWATTLARAEWPVPVLVENTAGGDGATTRTLEGVARLWDLIAAEPGVDVGFCLDTCHAWAAGLDLATVVADVRAITGRIDLVHCNSSRDPAGSGRDRHAAYAAGTIPPELLLHVVRDAGAPVVLETPAETVAEDLAWLRSAVAG